MSIAIITPIAGDKAGTFRDDLTDPNVGGWPKDVGIVRITNIAVYTGAVVDSVRITYQLTNNTTTTIVHGGPGGKLAKDFPLAANQKVVAVYGRQLKNPSKYGQKNIVQLSFVIATRGADGQGLATCEVQPVTAGEVTSPNSHFDFSWDLVGATSYTSQKSGAPGPVLQGLGFTEVPEKPT